MIILARNHATSHVLRLWKMDFLSDSVTFGWLHYHLRLSHVIFRRPLKCFLPRYNHAITSNLKRRLTCYFSALTNLSVWLIPTSQIGLKLDMGGLEATVFLKLLNDLLNIFS